MSKDKSLGSAGEMAVFVRAVDQGGFSAAARDLGLTPSGVSRVITRLEARLGVRLLNRTTRKLVLSLEGESYLARCRRILAEIEDAEAEVAGYRTQPRGLLRLNCIVSIGLHQVVPVLPEFLRRYPEIKVDLTLDDRRIDLIAEGADLAIRGGKMDDSSLIARHICDLERTICASPAYLKRHGTPKEPEDLLDHNCIMITGVPTMQVWNFDTPRGPVSIEPRGRITVNTVESMLELALHGAGITRFADMIAAEPIRQKRLIPLLVDSHRVEPVPLYAVYPQSRYRTPKLTAMLDFLMEKFAHAPWRSEMAPRHARTR